MHKHDSTITSGVEKLTGLLREKVAAHYADSFPELDAPTVDFTLGKKYARVFTDSADPRVHARSVMGFVDLETGDILRPKGWKAPALYSRGRCGNVKDDDHGLSNFTEYGVKYLA